jgi:hypothetical protein
MVTVLRNPTARFDSSARARLAIVEELQIGGRAALRFLAETGAFAFHGSPDAGRTLLRPRQPMTFSTTHRRMVRHGGVAVCATLDPTVAIYHAIMHMRSIAKHVSRYQSRFRIGSDGKVSFSATVGAIEFAARPETRGWVYVLDRAGFTTFSRMEVRRRTAVRPLAAIEVSGADLPRPVFVLEE